MPKSFFQENNPPLSKKKKQWLVSLLASTVSWLKSWNNLPALSHERPVQQLQNLAYIQLDIFQVEQLNIVLLL